jgi:hypothetical protein
MLGSCRPWCWPGLIAVIPAYGAGVFLEIEIPSIQSDCVPMIPTGRAIPSANATIPPAAAAPLVRRGLVDGAASGSQPGLIALLSEKTERRCPQSAPCPRNFLFAGISFCGGESRYSLGADELSRGSGSAEAAVAEGYFATPGRRPIAGLAWFSARRVQHLANPGPMLGRGVGPAS